MTPEAENLLRHGRTIAVVGLSSRPNRASFGVSRTMQRYGYTIIPVNPRETEVLGEKAYATLDEVPVPIDIVNIFRRPEFIPDLVEAAIRLHAKGIWMQLGIEHPIAAARARQAGLQVVEDTCIMVARAQLV